MNYLINDFEFWGEFGAVKRLKVEFYISPRDARDLGIFDGKFYVNKAEA